MSSIGVSAYWSSAELLQKKCVFLLHHFAWTNQEMGIVGVSAYWSSAKLLQKKCVLMLHHFAWTNQGMGSVGVSAYWSSAEFLPTSCETILLCMTESGNRQCLVSKPTSHRVTGAHLCQINFQCVEHEVVPFCGSRSEFKLSQQKHGCLCACLYICMHEWVCARERRWSLCKCCYSHTKKLGDWSRRR